MALTLGKAVGGLQLQLPCWQRYFHASAMLNKRTSGLYRSTPKKNLPLTYEMANAPHYLAHRKSWNAWNTSNILDGNRPSETAVEDEFIRRFMSGTWHNLFCTEVIIKRQHNMIRIAGIVQRHLQPSRMYFLIGYTQELLSYWLHCPVKLELQTVSHKKDIIFKYV